MQFGLVTEDVEKINPDLVVRDESGLVNTVHYDQVNAMLLNEFLKEHPKVRELEATLARQQNDFDAGFGNKKKQMSDAGIGASQSERPARMSKTRPQVASLPAVALREGGNNP